MKRILFILVILICGFAITAGASPKRKAADRMVRVAIVREAREINLEIDGPYTLHGATGKDIASGVRLPRTTVRLLEKGFFVGGTVYPLKRLVIEPRRDAAVKINNRRFRGDVVLIRTPKNQINAINSINIEDYIKGVLYHEVSHHWPMEALKAQAVAARTYALYSMVGANRKDFDVTNDIYSQVYGGKTSERYRTGLAVDRTSGEVLTYNGKILSSYFHATCAGMTEDAKEMWDLDLPPLKGVPCQFCQDSPHMHWHQSFQLQKIQASLNKAGQKIGLIKDIAVVDRDRSGRINHLKITGRQGEELVVRGKMFRQLLGPNVVKSNNYEITMKGYFVEFVGKGWGHGVGLCQWGARGMARQQFTYQQILAYYYPGTSLIDYHDLR